VRRTKTLEVSIPAGIASGKRVRMAGQGGPGLNGGQSGDVNLIITVRPDSRFEREGDNLRTDVDVPVTTAVLGGEVEVSTPTGKVALKVPPETQSGKSFRLRGQGMPKLRGKKGERGDLTARARIVTPTRLSERELELYQELQSLRAEKSSS
jgi:molecular chaperone DnaJ/curved DNA-binding protein